MGDAQVFMTGGASVRTGTAESLALARRWVACRYSDSLVVV
jgi:hypothetical protein